MSTWGCGLYQDDVTCDVKDDYLNWLRVGKTNEEATEWMLEYYKDYIDDEDDAPPFWFALADTQWKYGRLHPKVKKDALRYLELGTNLERWKEENPKLFPKRKKVLEELKERLESPMPPEKKVGKLKIFKANWDVGDLLLYQIHSTTEYEFDDVERSKWKQKYVLFRVVAITRSNVGSLPMKEYYHSSNVLKMYNWVGDKIPSEKEWEHWDFLPSRMREDEPMYFVDWNSKKEDIKIGLLLLESDVSYPQPSEKEQEIVNYCINPNIFACMVLKELKHSDQMGILNDQTK